MGHDSPAWIAKKRQAGMQSTAVSQDGALQDGSSQSRSSQGASPRNAAPQSDSLRNASPPAAGSGLPDRAQVVVIGGGIVGCSVAYHLTRRGISDVLLLEQGSLTSGTTWHAAGLVSQLKSTHSLTKLATYSARLFEELEDETGQATGYRTPGSISVAADDERWEEVRRGAAMAATVGVETRVIDRDELQERWPLIRTDDVVGALFIPRDGHTSPVDTTMALAKGARSRGARIVEGVAVIRAEHRPMVP